MRHKIILPLIILLFSFSHLQAQVKLSGKITDAGTGEKLRGVSIYMSVLKIGVSSDGNGRYQVNSLKPGQYLLEISLVGYKTIISNIVIQKDTIVDFPLIPANNELTEVIVTGVTRSTELKLSPIIVKSIDRNNFNQNSASNLIDALKNVPGVSQITSGASISKPVIRGLGYNRVITLDNGIRQEGQQWGDEHGIEMDEYGVDRVEIVKGPGSLIYGSDGIAGVLNFLPPKLVSADDIKTQFVSNYQSNNNMLGYSLSNAGSRNGFHWSGRFSQKSAGNYQNKYDGKVFNSGFKEQDQQIFLGVNKSWGHSHITWSRFNNTLNLVEGERDALGRFTYVNKNGVSVTATDNELKGRQIGVPHQGVTHEKLISNNYFILNNGTLHADLAYQDNQRKEFGNPLQPNQFGLFFDLQTINYSIRYNLQKIKGWETTYGMGGMKQTSANRGTEFLIPAYGLFDAGAFVFSQKTFKKLVFAGGVRYDNRSYHSKELILDANGNSIPSPSQNSTTKFSAFNSTFSGISGSMGISYQLNPLSTLKLNLSRGFRAPNASELSSNGRHEGTFRYEIGNNHLKSEISHQLDIAYFFNSDHITFEFTPFLNLISHYIFVEKLKSKNGLDSIPDPTDPAPGFKYTSGNAILMGSEIYLDLHPHPLDWLHLENSFSFVQASQHGQSDSTKYLPFIPAPKYRGEVKVQFKKVPAVLSNAYFKLSLDQYFSQTRVFSAYGTETATPSYTLLSASIGSNIKVHKKADAMSIFITGDNLTNVAYQSHLSRLKYAAENMLTGRTGVFNMGRSISVKMIFKF